MANSPYPHVIARAIAYEETGDDDWSELETSYGGGGYRIDRTAAIASSLVFTVLKTTPINPMSSACLTIQGSAPP